MPVLPYSPLRCRNCRSVLNPFSVVDFEAKIWICPICFHRNHFPPHHAASISPDTLPPELFPQYTTVEYQQDDASSPSPLTCLFVVDTCLLEEEIDFLRSTLSQAMHLIPDTSLVGLITFGSFVQVHELGFPHLPKTYVFNGSKEHSRDSLLDHLGFFLKKPRPPSGVIASVRDGLSPDAISRAPHSFSA
ncbi:hypothetical protein Tsubulata_020817 [Turnera subulata]|uniref:Protein transport protein SEC23 n=1 Tax=Turnera subulata TaxID=218843 RepID=A0A9Q0JJ49_9ROSI|nr:hypothetical protein Tsubulata_020817 [Turnera subulata]